MPTDRSEPIRVDSVDDPRVAAFRDVPDPVLVRQRGVFVAEGRFVIRRVLAERRFAVRALLMTDTALAALADVLAVTRQPRPPVYLATRQLLRAIGGYDFHQGCLGLARRPPAVATDTLLRERGSTGPIVVLEQVGNPDNIGGIFRNAAAFGATAVLLSPGCGDPLYRKAIRTSIGATLHVPYAVIEDWPGGLAVVWGHGYHLAALTPDPGASDLDAYRPPRDSRGVALVLGNEGDGLTEETLRRADVRVRIPIEPPVDSLNVATKRRPSPCTASGVSPKPTDWSISEATHQMVVDHSCRLHEGVTDGGADKAEAASLEVLAHRVGGFGLGRHVLHTLPRVPERAPSDEPPDVIVERAEFLLYLQKRPCVRYARLDLQTVPDDARIGEQSVHLSRVVTRNTPWVEPRERSPVVLTLPKDGEPAETGLRSLQNQHLEERAVVVCWRAPLVVVIRDIEWVGVTPWAPHTKLRHLTGPGPRRAVPAPLPRHGERRRACLRWARHP